MRLPNTVWRYKLSQIQWNEKWRRKIIPLTPGIKSCSFPVSNFSLALGVRLPPYNWKRYSQHEFIPKRGPFVQWQRSSSISDPPQRRSQTLRYLRTLPGSRNHCIALSLLYCWASKRAIAYIIQLCICFNSKRFTCLDKLVGMLLWLQKHGLQ